jgi:UDP-MurNAc hydroxylase
MELTLLSHASVVIRHGGIGIWTDPWLVGKAFNNSWTLLPAPDPKSVPYEQIDYLWLSHEHPDHFNIPTLRSLPEHFKKRVTVLVQRTNSEKIAEAMRRMGFERFVSLDHRKRVRLANDVEIYCYQTHIVDSCLAVAGGGHVVFDVNDAELGESDCRTVLADLGEVDVVLNQFSLAGYIGPIERDEILPRMARDKLVRILDNHRQLKTKTTVPFASFVYFSTVDNGYMNAYMNTPQAVYREFVERELSCALMFPGDRWEISQPFASEPNVGRFSELFSDVSRLPLEEPPVVPAAEIIEEVAAFHATVRERYPSVLLRAIAPLTVFVPDLKIALEIDVAHGRAKEVELDESECDLSVYSQPLWFTFKFPFGAETLAVSGRLTVRRRFANWQRFKRLCILNSAEIYLTPRHLVRRANLYYMAHRLRGSLLGQIVAGMRRQAGILRGEGPTAG